MGRLSRAALTVAATGMVFFAVSTPASATTTTSAAARSDASQTCVAEAVPMNSSEAAAPMRCYSSFAEAIADATNGAVQLPADATTVTQQQLDAGYAKARAAATFVVGESWTGHFIGDGENVLHEASTDCDTDSGAEWMIPNLPDNNSYGAGRAFGNCQGIYWDLANCGPDGARDSTPWEGGAMDNRVTSICWH